MDFQAVVRSAMKKQEEEEESVHENVTSKQEEAEEAQDQFPVSIGMEPLGKRRWISAVTKIQAYREFENSARRRADQSSQSDIMGCPETVDVRRLKRRFSSQSLRKSIKGRHASEAPSFVSSLGIVDEDNLGVDNKVFDDDKDDKDDDSDDGFGSVTEKLEVQSKKSFRISYSLVVWFVFLLVTVLCIVDRFTGTGDIVLKRSGKRVSKLWGANVGQTINNVLWAITARLIITAQNMMFYSVLWCFPNILFELAPQWVAVTGIRDIHMKMHRIVGVFMIAIPSLVHVLIVFLPPLVDRTQLTYSPPTSFNYSDQWMNLNWTKIWDPAAVQGFKFNDEKGVHLGSDELYRFFLMVATFCVVFPLTLSGFLNKRSYSLAVGVHLFAGVWYAIDNIRKITHGLAHVFNLPFLLLWMLDRILSVTVYRKSTAVVVRRTVIGAHEYLELRLKKDKDHQHGFGDIYYFLEKHGALRNLSPERSHPFTTFSNHSNDTSWDIGVIVNVVEDYEQWFPAFTRICSNFEAKEQDPSQLRCWGPYRSSVWELHRQIKENAKFPCILIASGSGFGYLMDVLGFLAHKKKMEDGELILSLDIYYTVRCASFLSFYRKEIDTLLDRIHMRHTAFVTFNWHYTGQRIETVSATKTPSRINVFNGRINFDEILFNAGKASVYFVGNPTVAERIAKVCEKYKLDLIRDYTNNQLPDSDRKVVVKYLALSFKIVSYAVVFLMFLGIYLKTTA